MQYGPLGYQVNTSKKGTNYLSKFTECTKVLWYVDIHLARGYTVGNRGFVATDLHIPSLPELKPPDRILAYAAEVERAVAFDNVGDLGEAIR